MNSSNRHDEATMDWLLDAYWERHIAGAPATTADRALDPALAATVRHLHAHDDAPGPDRAFVRRLRADLAMSTAAPVPLSLRTPDAIDGGIARGPATGTARRPPRRFVTSRVMQIAAVVALLVTAAGLIAYLRGPASPSDERPDERRYLPAVATPAATEGALASCPMPTGSVIPAAAGYFTEWGLGAAPVWLIGWGNAPAALQPQYPTAGVTSIGSNFVQTPYGWGMRAIWAIAGGWTEPVTLHGNRLEDGAPVWFGIVGQEPTTSPVLDPANPGIPVQHGTWREWPSSMSFPATGCYELVAEWAGGSWRVQIPFVAPAATPLSPTAGGCVIEPRAMDDILNTLATPVAGTPAAGILAAPPRIAGEPADPETFAAVRGVVELVYDCLAAGDRPRLYALLTDDAVRAFQARGMIQPDEVVGRLGPREAYLIQDVRVLPDGRVVAVIEFHVPVGAFTETWIFARQGQRLLIDAVVVPAPSPATPSP